MSIKRFIIVYILTVFISFLMLYGVIQINVEADEQGEVITKEKTISQTFNENNPSGSINLKQIFEEELSRPEECQGTLVYCQIQEVSFDITIKKEWLKLNLNDLSNYQFSRTVPRIKNPIDQLTKQETVIMQETLARRGLLQYLDGSVVAERGFHGALTSLGLYRLAHIKGIEADDPNFNEKLTDEINKLLENMANDENYVNNRALPSKIEMEPQEGDSLYDKWNDFQYIAKLAENSEPVNTGIIPIDNNIDVTIDGYLNVERISE